MLKNKKGFTLIELLIVVAIIAILAAIAIPQFSSYRIRGYNAAANSDLRNMKLAQESFKTDWEVYPSTAACAATAPYAGCTGALGAGALVSGPGTVGMDIAQYAIVATLYPKAGTAFAFGLSSGVTAAITTTAVTGANYTAYTSHAQGDIIYAADSDLTQIKMAGKSAAGIVTTLTTKIPGRVLQAVPASTAVDDLTAVEWASM